MKNIYIIIPCHNRSAYTLSCLDNLKKLGIIEKYSVIVIDDGSSDGTAVKVEIQYPEVIILHGSGHLYWTGAIELGMRYAMKQGAECMIWLNDDLAVASGSIERIVEICRETNGIASAQSFINKNNGEKYFYHAKIKGKKDMIHKDVSQEKGVISVDACRGNLVAISRCVVELIGYPDGKHIPHVFGDADYTLTATEAGISCQLILDVLLEDLDAIRSDNHSWLLGEKPIMDIWKAIFSKRNAYYPPMRWIYLTRHWGWRGMLQFPLPYLKLGVISLIRILLPRKLLIFLYGNHSHAWKATAWSRSVSENT